MKIYTKKGDKGITALYGGKRVKKYNLRIKCYGTVDELNSHIGLIRSQEINVFAIDTLLEIQNNLFVIGAMLSTPQEKEPLSIPIIDESEIKYLEKEIDKIDYELPKLKNFIHPGGHQVVSFCDIARCVCRRAERLSIELNDQEPINNNIIIYLNRLSDYLFMLARKLSKELLVDEIKWESRKKD